MSDLIADFTSGQDRIDLSAMDAVRGTAANDAFTWIGAGAFSDVAGQLRAVTSGNYVQIEGDTDGNGVADPLIMAATTAIAPGGFVF